MDWISELPWGFWLVTAGCLIFLALIFWRLRKKNEKVVQEEAPDFSRRYSGKTAEPKARDPLDNSLLGESTEDISVQAPSGKIILIRVNRRNAEIVRQYGFGVFPNLKHNLEQYGRNHRRYYRRDFQPEHYYYVVGGWPDFDPIMWWIYFDLFFGHDYDAPAYDYDSQMSLDTLREYQERYTESLQSWPEQNDPAGLNPYLAAGSQADRLGQAEEPAPHRAETASEFGEARGQAVPVQQQEDPVDTREHLDGHEITIHREESSGSPCESSYEISSSSESVDTGGGDSGGGGGSYD